MTYYEFCKKWEQMPQNDNGYLGLGISHELDLQIGYHVDGIKSLVIMDTDKISEIPSSRVIKVTNSQLVNGKYFLEFQLLNKDFEEIYLHLCWDIITYSNNVNKPLIRLIERYISWQKLLDHVSEDVMSFQSQKGLLGELLQLEELINAIGAEKAVASWLGPDGSDQDFVFENSWTEVKTVALAAMSVRISSLEQLEQEKDGHLKVFVLERTTAGSDRVALVKQVEKVKSKLPQDICDSFEMKLYKYGYREKDKDIYVKNEFRYIEERDYLVDKNFPKLTRGNVPIGIIKCAYQIDFVSIENFRR